MADLSSSTAYPSVARFLKTYDFLQPFMTLLQKHCMSYEIDDKQKMGLDEFLFIWDHVRFDHDSSWYGKKTEHACATMLSDFNAFCCCKDHDCFEISCETAVAAFVTSFFTFLRGELSPHEMQLFEIAMIDMVRSALEEYRGEIFQACNLENCSCGYAKRLYKKHKKQ